MDTEATISVIAPATVLELGLKQRRWDSPEVLLANGQRANPEGTVDIDVVTSRRCQENGSYTAKGRSTATPWK